MRRKQPVKSEVLNSNDKLIFLLDTLPEAVIFLDGSATIQYANARAAMILKTDKHELISSVLWQHVPHLITTAFYQVLLTATNTHEPSEFEYYSPIARTWLRMRLLPTDGGLAVFVTEEAERPQNPLRQNEQRYQDLLKSLSEYVAVLTPQ